MRELAKAITVATIMKGTEVPNPRHCSACDCTCVLTESITNTVQCNKFHVPLCMWTIYRHGRMETTADQWEYTGGIFKMDHHLHRMWRTGVYRKLKRQSFRER